MATSIRLPPRLLARVDARAKALGLSRNRVLVETIESGLAGTSAWPPELLALLSTPLDGQSRRMLDRTLREARRLRRNRRAPPEL